MKASILAAATALLAATAQAAPAPVQKEARQFQVSITFHGAAGQSYSQSFPADDTTHAITNPLSISEISSVGGGFCTFRGIDGSETVVVGEGTFPVGPPQTQVSGTCDVL